MNVPPSANQRAHEPFSLHGHTPRTPREMISVLAVIHGVRARGDGLVSEYNGHETARERKREVADDDDGDVSGDGGGDRRVKVERKGMIGPGEETNQPIARGAVSSVCGSLINNGPRQGHGLLTFRI